MARNCTTWKGAWQRFGRRSRQRFQFFGIVLAEMAEGYAQPTSGLVLSRVGCQLPWQPKRESHRTLGQSFRKSKRSHVVAGARCRRRRSHSKKLQESRGRRRRGIGAGDPGDPTGERPAHRRDNVDRRSGPRSRGRVPAPRDTTRPLSFYIAYALTSPRKPAERKPPPISIAEYVQAGAAKLNRTTPPAIRCAASVGASGASKSTSVARASPSSR